MIIARSSLLRALVAVLWLAVIGSLSVSAESVDTSSEYLPTRDGTRLAVDIHLPGDRSPDARLPALLVLTRYWRSSENPETGELVAALSPLDEYFLSHGYAIVKVDVRGSGASFGSRRWEYGAQEVRDGYDVVEWVVSQPWSNGAVGGFGTSYTGTTAELLAAAGHPAVKAVIPGWSDFDIYVSPVRPYGLVASSFLRQWSQYVGWLDDNDSAQLGASVRRVAADDDGTMLAAAVEDHRANPEVFEVVRRTEYRDDEVEGIRPYEVGPLLWLDTLERSRVPMLVLVSWLDAGTVDGALQRFVELSNPQKLVIMATNHGGASHASPFVVDSEPVAPRPSVEEQFALRLAFFDHYLQGGEPQVAEWPAIRYYNLGEEAFRESRQWPVPDTHSKRLYFREGRRLMAESPAADDGRDSSRVDFTASTGSRNRWATQMGTPVLGLSDRGEMDERLLTYTSEPLAADLQVTGAPVVCLQVASDREDGAFLAYLEAVDRQGRSRYITEGGLRAVHRKSWRDPRFGDHGPMHSFRRSDSAPLVPGEVTEICFRMWPTSVLFRSGHRVRVAIAGADADTFDRLPSDGDATISVYRNAEHASFLDLPVVSPPADFGGSHEVESRLPLR